jgi:hypothetical protein
VLEDRLKESEHRERLLTDEKDHISRNNKYYRKKAQSLKRSGEQGIKHVMEAASGRELKAGQSLPRLDQK